MENVGTSDKIGELTSINLSEQINVQAQTGGTLIQLKCRDLVDTGSSLFTLGVESAEMIAKLRLWTLRKRNTLMFPAEIGQD
jgi:hypothetical protein